MKHLLTLLLVCFSATSFSAPKYTSISNIENEINGKFGSVSSNGALTLPIITWGGDIATIYANGNQKNTVPSSILGKTGKRYTLVREDDFKKQVEHYIAGKTPFLRGTMGMINSASDALSNPALKPIVFYQLSWSAGGDALVVKNNIKTVKDLKGKTIAIQAFGPHMDYLSRVLKDANLSKNDVKLKWLPDLTGTNDSPMAALYESNIDAAFVITPDAMALTSGGQVGTGSEDSVKGARILMSTKTANRVIADVYAVRSDYYKSHKKDIETLAKSLAAAQEEVNKLKNKSSSEYKNLMKSSALLLLDSAQATADAEGLFGDCELVGTQGNEQFFNNANNLRNFDKLSSESRSALKEFNIISAKNSLSSAAITFNQNTRPQLAKTPKFNKDEVSRLVSKKQQQGSLSDNEIFSFEVLFAPNQNAFSTEQYQVEFDKVMELSAAYGGAVITVEGHSDPMGYLRAKKKGENPVVLGRIKQSAKNLSISRAQSVTEAIINYAQNSNVLLDQSQFEPIGQGISQPATGICGNDPCAPKNENEWRSNMRVVFRLIQIEAESDAFMPL